jgi:hypothetical protein
LKLTTELIDEIMTIKVNSGEELIAKIVEVSDDHLMISTPVSVAPGQQSMGLMPTFFTADRELPARINISAIALIAHTADEVKVRYIEATTGLSVPPKKKLILG